MRRTRSAAVSLEGERSPRCRTISGVALRPTSSATRSRAGSSRRPYRRARSRSTPPWTKGAGTGAAILLVEERNGWEMVGLYEDDGISGKSTDRPGLQSSLSALRTGQDRIADGLMSAKLDRLSRPVMDFGELLAVSRRQRWSIAVLDFDLDTSTATGRPIARMVVQIAQWEREMIGERTKAALVLKRARGIQLGKPSTIRADFQAFILKRKAAGASLSAIARSLNADDVPTSSGAARWTHSLIGGVVRRWATKAEVSA
ncbi:MULTISPECIES: recombinase family protein [unclassified Rathayibacter]|uniref:recombinase family protein n=1 Tax=unclassified Rathayibacter TaxID=2609250 RepID=UPI002157E3E1|nr:MULTISPECIES: recombinase family protein [unclassified Rathayibacter]